MIELPLNKYLTGYELSCEGTHGPVNLGAAVFTPRASAFSARPATMLVHWYVLHIVRSAVLVSRNLHPNCHACALFLTPATLSTTRTSIYGTEDSACPQCQTVFVLPAVTPEARVSKLVLEILADEVSVEIFKF